MCAAVSYALQTVYASFGDAPALVVPVVGAPIPFYWRVALALFHGLLVGLLAVLGLDEAQSARVLDRLPVAVPVVILPLAGLMVVVS